jgi:filamentous hemagglutinin
MAGFGSVKDKQSSTTQAGITGVAGNTAARTGDAETGLKPVFTQADVDKINKSLAVQTNVTGEFGKNAAKFVGDTAGKKQKELTDQATQARAAGNTVEADRLTREAGLWAEGGAYRVAMHIVAGAMGGGINGAAGAAASSLAAPVMDKIQTQMQDSLVAGGMNAEVAKATASLLTAGASAAIAGAAGGVQGATTGFNVDLNNRQLHPSETKWIKDNAKKYAILNPGMSEAEAEKQLADQAFRQVQFGAEGAWDPKAQSFLKQAGNQMLPTDPIAGNTGPGFMFYATPQQKADATMYLSALVNDPQALKFYQDNKIKQPSQTDLQSAAMRDAQIRANLGTATKTAFAAAATIALAGVPPTLLSWALANPVAASSAGIITAETAAAITSGAITPSSLAPVLAAGGVKTVTQLGEAMAGQAATATTGGFINASKVCQSACAIGGLTIEEQALALLIKNGGDAKGTQTEALLTSVAQRTGMTVLDGGKYGSNNGFDLVLKGKDGAITVILDGKQLTSSGAVQLSNQGAGGTNQLSPGWVDEVIKNIRNTNPGSPAIAAIQAARDTGTLSIGVGGVNRTTGQLLVLPVTVPNKKP